MAVRTDEQRTGTFQWVLAEDNTWEPAASPQTSLAGAGGEGTLYIQPQQPSITTTPDGSPLWLDTNLLPDVATGVYVQPDQPDLADVPTGSPLWLDTDAQPATTEVLLERIEALETRMAELERGV